MEFLIELLLELFFEVPFDMAMESRRLKSWVKTLLFSTLCCAIAVLLGVIAFTPPLIPVVVAIFAIWLIFSVVGAIIGHRRKWKNP